MPRITCACVGLKEGGLNTEGVVDLVKRKAFSDDKMEVVAYASRTVTVGRVNLKVGSFYFQAAGGDLTRNDGQYEGSETVVVDMSQEIFQKLIADENICIM